VIGDQDVRFMRRALALAAEGIGRTAPNPPVGCVLVSGEIMVAEGWHSQAGSDHAEVDALRNCPNDVSDLTAYVTLEPCNHTGQTGPCTEALIDAGVKRVVIGCMDPNPSVNGAGVERLQQAGLEVQVGVLESESRVLIRPFAQWITTGRPLVTLKIATTLDGRIATTTGHSQWVTSEEARHCSHRLRDRMDAILVGAGTIRADDPQLTARLPDVAGVDPIRVVVSASLNLPDEARVFSVQSEAPTWVVTGLETPRVDVLKKRGIDVFTVGGTDEAVDLKAALNALGDRGVTALLVEGGQQLGTALLQAQLVDRVCCFVAPKIVGDDGLAWAGGLGIRTMDQALTLSNVAIRPIGNDVCIEGDCVYGNC
jgi:diaminohydroxyphosphoribosylaminopyrimidine deaminase/5-amino-6-(5-phosphoribosylamino)uracil reductase